MSLTGLITFIAGTKAKASEVNSNFTKVKSFVDTLESNIATNTADISALESDKANVNGNASNRFAVADAVNNTDAMNKQKFMEMTHNSRRFINGLNVTKTDDDTIAIAIGSAFDSTFEKIMLLNAGASVTNSTQSASTTYYVYLISKEDGTTQCIISTEAVTPTLPSTYLYFRQIGLYTTDDKNSICAIESYSASGIAKEQASKKFPDYFNGSTLNMYPVVNDGSSGTYDRADYKYQAEGDCWIRIDRPFGFGLKVSEDDSSYTLIASADNGGQGFITTTGFVPIQAGTWFYAYPVQDTNNLTYKSYPAKSGV